MPEREEPTEPADERAVSTITWLAAEMVGDRLFAPWRLQTLARRLVSRYRREVTEARALGRERPTSKPTA